MCYRGSSMPMRAICCPARLRLSLEYDFASGDRPGVRAEIAPGKRFNAFVSYRPMWLAERRDAFATTGVRYWFVPGLLRGEINAFVLAKGRFLLDAPNAPDTGDTRYFSFAMTAAF